MIEHVVLRVIAKLLAPFIVLFALYVQFHGDFGPGGGFQAGVIFASAFILFALIYGVENARQIAPPAVAQAGIGLGVLLYAGTGVAGMLLGGKYLDYSVLAQDAGDGQHYGILIIEFGVGVTVAAVMITVFFTFAGRRGVLEAREDTGVRHDGDEER
ncbi:MAG: Na(+)/H(+) antiporter subunit B [Rhodospirillaceae bacterium]|nr:Na(+)/H(+) antiporter subunit B [Rhodospirillaceae bacterium]